MILAFVYKLEIMAGNHLISFTFDARKKLCNLNGKYKEHAKVLSLKTCHKHCQSSYLLNDKFMIACKKLLPFLVLQCS